MTDEQLRVLRAIDTGKSPLLPRDLVQPLVDQGLVAEQISGARQEESGAYSGTRVLSVTEKGKALLEEYFKPQGQK